MCKFNFFDGADIVGKHTKEEILDALNYKLERFIRSLPTVLLRKLKNKGYSTNIAYGKDGMLYALIPTGLSAMDVLVPERRVDEDVA